VITLELGFIIDHYYFVGYLLVFILSYSNKNNNKSNLIIISLVMIHCIFHMYLRDEPDFYTYYLWSAFKRCLMIFLSIIIHLHFHIKHQQTTVYAYYLYIMCSFGYMMIHRVRVVIYDTDEPILWLMNLNLVII